MTDQQQQQLDAAHDRQVEQQALAAAEKEAMQEVTENANLLRELRRAGIDTDKYPWLEGVLGPETAASHAIGNRSADYEQVVKWGAMGKAMQHVAERSPGRLCRDEVLAVARGTHKREDKQPEPEFSVDERRVIRAAYEAAANHKSLAAKGRGLKTVGETTVTAKREVREEASSWRERAGEVLD
jgi:hypothetical protein